MFCPNCGKEVEKHEKICKYCSQMLDGISDKKTKSEGEILTFIFCIIFFLFFIECIKLIPGIPLGIKEFFGGIWQLMKREAGIYD